MLHVACATEYFPLTLSLSLRERSPRTLIAPCAHEPVFEHSFISNNLRVRFMGRAGVRGKKPPRRAERAFPPGHAAVARLAICLWAAHDSTSPALAGVDGF